MNTTRKKANLHFVMGLVSFGNFIMGLGLPMCKPKARPHVDFANHSRPGPGGEREGQGEGGLGERRNGKAPAPHVGAGGGRRADLADEQPGRWLPHAHLKLP